MRRILARLILAFARVVTLLLNPMRRGDAQRIARDLLAPVQRVETKRGQLIFDTSSRWSFRSALRFHEGEPETLAWIDGFLDDACFWDIGANVGTFSLYAALGSVVRVLAFEPGSSSFAILNRNVELNHLSMQVTAYCLAFSRETKLDRLNMAGTAAGLSMHGFGTDRDQLDNLIDIRYRQGCVGFSMDDFVSTFSPPLPSHVKIDVDGIEAEILQGGQKTLSAPSVRSMSVEIEGDLQSARNQEILSLMAELGFVALPKESERTRNVIFERLPV